MDEKPGKSKDRERDRSKAAERALSEKPEAAAAPPDGAADGGADRLRLTREVRIGLGVVVGLLLIFGYVFVRKIADADGSPTISLPRTDSETAASDRPGGGAPILVENEKRDERVGHSPDGPPHGDSGLPAGDDSEHFADGRPSFLPHRKVAADVAEIAQPYDEADVAPGDAHDAAASSPGRADEGTHSYVERRAAAEKVVDATAPEKPAPEEPAAPRTAASEKRHDRPGVRLPGVDEPRGPVAATLPNDARREALRVRTRVYTVRAGETIYDIARRELGRVSRWKEIIALNRETVGEDIEAIEPGMKIYLPDERSGSVARGRDELPWR